MTPLTDETMFPIPTALSVDDVPALVASRIAVAAGVETVALRDADGRVLAQDVVAPFDLPRFDNAAMDGFAVRSCDLLADAATRLPVLGRIAAGDQAGNAETRPAAIRIFTGAPMPAGFDTVVMQEDVRIEDGTAVLPPGLAAGANRRLAGEDIAAGAVGVAAGERLSPTGLGLLAGLGQTHLAVRHRIRVALASTGNELVEPGEPLRPGLIHDANRTLLAALLRRAGADVTDLGILRDDPGDLAAALGAAAAGHDLILTSGGVSVGEEDHVKAALGRSVAFWRLAVKPGRPVAMGSIGSTTVIGLPGNPVAAYVAFMVVVRPVLARLGGETFRPLPRIPLPAAFTHRKRSGRREFVRATLVATPEGGVALQKFGRDGSSLLTSLARSDGLAEIPEHVTEVEPDDILRFIPHPALP